MPTVLILGATSSIGRAVAAELARLHYDLVLAGRDLEELEIMAADLEVRRGVKASARRWDAVAFERQAEDLQTCLSGGKAIWRV